MDFPERHPLLGWYARLGWVLILLGAAGVSLGVLAGRYSVPLAPGTNSAPWQLAWWETFGWSYGLLLIVVGVAVLVFRAVQKRDMLFGDRIRREYK